MTCVGSFCPVDFNQAATSCAKANHARTVYNHDDIRSLENQLILAAEAPWTFNIDNEFLYIILLPENYTHECGLDGALVHQHRLF